jgi:predicted ATPase/DNA-binding SARP family transcriptional activator
MAGIRLSLLGPFAAAVDGRPVPGFRTRATQALLIYLAVRPGQPQRREHLMTLLWPGLAQKSAQANLRQTLYQLRQAIPETAATGDCDPVPLLLSDWQTVRINPDAALEVDVLAFERLLDEGESGWAAAVDLYRGDFLDDFYLPDSPAFEEWAQARREELRGRFLKTLDVLAESALTGGDPAAAEAYARRQLALDNLREGAYRQLMLALTALGRRSEALAQHESCRRLLRDELGVEPSPQTRALYERLARGELPDTADSPAGPGATGPASARARPRHNLPLQLSSFIGRERELAEIRGLLSTSRLVTLTGAGGCGKTRLALQGAAGVVNDYVDGAWLVELAPLADPAEVPQAVASALDLRDYEDRPPLELLLSYLRPRQLLLVLDNCEHLVEAAAQLAATFLAHCPQLHILATSRESLNIAGETAWLVPSLSLPEAGEPLAAIEQADAIRLFTERAAAALPGFSLTGDNAAAVAQLCQRLDGLPLAIELAAARVKLLQVEQLLARLDDRFRLLTGGSRAARPRHQTLAALIDWSYDLLSPAEQRLLRRLSVFAGGFSLEAAEAVCAPENKDEVLELLAQLVNKSLVVSGRAPGQAARYHLLETIRQYAWARLAEAGEADPAQAAHLAYFVRLAETADPGLASGEQLRWLERLDAEHDNLQAALGWSLDEREGQIESGLRLAAALATYWLRRPDWASHRWLVAALEKREAAAPPVRAKFLVNAGLLWVNKEWDGDPASLLEEGLALCRQLGDRRGIGWGLLSLGWSALKYRGNPGAAASLFSESLALAREIDDKPLMVLDYLSLAFITQGKGDYEQSEELSSSGLAMARETGAPGLIVWGLYSLSRDLCARGRYEEATEGDLEALALARELKDKDLEQRLLNSLGEKARLQRAYEQAALYYHESLAVAREVASQMQLGTVAHNLGVVALGQGDRPQARSYFRESVALQEQSDILYAAGWNVWALGRLALAEGQLAAGVRLLAAGLGHLRIHADPVDPIDREDTDRELAQARAHLGEAAFAAAWAAGQAMTLEEAIELAFMV